ncbi:MAG: hypothetical protein GX493_07365 [Firmicutes bacterium]|nr:hypothetical protein [Bacillota bacterium]
MVDEEQDDERPADIAPPDLRRRPNHAFFVAGRLAREDYPAGLSHRRQAVDLLGGEDDGFGHQYVCSDV